MCGGETPQQVQGIQINKRTVCGKESKKPVSKSARVSQLLRLLDSSAGPAKNPRARARACLCVRACVRACVCVRVCVRKRP